MHLRLVQFYHLELLLALLNEQLAVLIEHIHCYLELSVCNLISGNGQAALLDGSETFTGVRIQSQLLNKGNNSFTIAFELTARQ